MKRSILFRCTYISFFLAFFLNGEIVHAQDANYWSFNYGPGGFLTPGSVLAYNKDSGVFFFNPALLAFTHKNSASITGNLYQFESTTIKNGIGTGLNLYSGSASIIPLMGAGSIAIKGKHPFVIGYALIRNPVSSFQTTQRKDARFNVLDDSYSPGPEYYIGQFSENNQITETSGLLSIGFKINSAFSAGFTVEGQVRKQNYNQNFSSRALYNQGTDTISPPVASAEGTYLANFTHVGIRFKGGLSYNASGHHLGLLLTAPLIRLYGKGTIYGDEVVNDLKLLIGDLSENFLASTRQTGVNARWKTPLSLGLGYAYDYSGSGQIYFAAEYFDKISDYNIMTPRNEYFIRPDTGSNNESTASLLKFKDAHKSLVNFSLGINFPLTPSVLGYCSLRTDFTYADSSLYKDTDGVQANTSNWNNWHMELGANLKKRKFNLRVGLLLSYGRTNKYLQPFNFDNPNEENTLQGYPHFVPAHRYAGGLLFSYIHNL